jgi:hypothetical protein
VDHLTDVVAALAPRLGPGEALAAVQSSLELAGKATGAPTLDHLARAVAALAPRLGPEGAAAAVRLALREMAATSDPAVARSLAGMLGTLLTGPTGGETDRRARLLALALGGGTGSPAPLAGLVPLLAAGRPLPGWFAEQQLIDFLKLPTCQGPARALILAQLGQQCGQTFRNLWESAEWAQGRGLDLTSPPVSAP